VLKIQKVEAGLHDVTLENWCCGYCALSKSVSTGYGDYTAEREALFADMSLVDILTGIKLERKWNDNENQSAVD
jgi:hypothetical protein